MKKTVFLVEQEAVRPTRIANVTKIVDGVERLHPTKNCYYVVSKPNGDYVQVAGSADRLIVETRVHTGDKFAHYVIGNDSEPGLIDKIECNVGPIRLNQNQVLTIADAKLIIEAFCRGLPWPEQYKLADVTERFL